MCSLCMCVRVAVEGGGQYVCVKWADKGCEGRYVAFSFRGQGTVHHSLASSFLVCKINARWMQDECKQC